MSRFVFIYMYIYIYIAAVISSIAARKSSSWRTYVLHFIGRIFEDKCGRLDEMELMKSENNGWSKKYCGFAVFSFWAGDWNIFFLKELCHIIICMILGWSKGITPQKTNMTGWNIHHEWRCISYWKWWIFQCHLSELRGLNCSIQFVRFETRRPRVGPLNSLVEATVRRALFHVTALCAQRRR